MSIVTGKAGLNRYKRLDKLGEGTYGYVYRALDQEKNLIVAIKKIKLEHNEEGIPATTLREVSLLQHLKHPNIVEMSGVLYDQGELYLVFEFIDRDLKACLDKMAHAQYPTARQLKLWVYALTEGIRFCHARRILHRDLKPQNILISDNGDLKIADFGLGREHGLPMKTLTHEVVTLWYRPPEILLGKKRYSGSADVWGIGCIMAEMANKMPLFTGDSEIDQLFQIYRVLGTPNPSVWPDVNAMPDFKAQGIPQWKPKDLAKELGPKHRLDADGIELIQKTLIYAPNRRITAKQMLLHRWFDEVREEMKAVFGAGFPHCGSPEYQKEQHRLKYQNIREVAVNVADGAKEEEDRKELDEEHDEDYSGNEEEEEDTDLENDEDVDIGHNPRGDGPWKNHRIMRRAGGRQTAAVENLNVNLSQPMEQDE